MRFRGAGFSPLLETYCPPGRVWWNERTKIIRACDQTTVAIKDARGQVVRVVTVDTNCYFVCERFIWGRGLRAADPAALSAPAALARPSLDTLSPPPGRGFAGVQS